MDLQLKNKRVFISGSSKGIGFATAKTLAKEGAEVIINGRTQSSVQQALEQMKSEGIPVDKIKGEACDFSKPEEVKTLIPKLGKIDILINNVGLYQPKGFLEITDEDWEALFQLNVMSGVRLTRALLPAMIKQNWGRVIFISSESALNLPEEAIHYGVTKTALLGLSRGIAETLKGTEVTVNSILPGPTNTEAVKNMLKEGQTLEDLEKTFFQKIRPTSILQRFTDPQEVANLIAFVASPLSSGTQGASLRVDGGTVKTI